MNASSLPKDDLSRRRFVERLARTTLGVSLASAPVAQAALAAASAKKPLADQCILLMMSGGMSHLDTFDPKPEKSEVMGKTGIIKTSITGEAFADNIPNLAKMANKLAVIRSMFQKTADHQQATYQMRTSYSAIPTIIHPSMGPWAQRLLGRRNATLPDSVTIGAGVNHPGAGFLPPEFSPMPVDDAARGVPNMTPYGYGSDEQSLTQYDALLKRRLDLTEKLDATFRTEVKHEKVSAYTKFYDETLKFLRSEDLKLFDLSKESAEVRERYGKSSIGQGCLLAKRLVKGGVRFVEVSHGGWDTHVDNFDRVPEIAGTMDVAISNLIADLEAEGLLSRTLVVIATEFGRTPKINSNDGRDHHSIAFSCALAGGGVRGGQIIGKSDATGERLASEQTEAKTLNATIAHALGLDLNQVIYSPSGRPFTVATHKGVGDKIVTDAKPLLQVFS